MSEFGLGKQRSLGEQLLRKAGREESVGLKEDFIIMIVQGSTRKDAAWTTTRRRI